MRHDPWGGALMLADLDLLLIAVYRMADDFLPVRIGNARRWTTGAEFVTLCVAQAITQTASESAVRDGRSCPTRP